MIADVVRERAAAAASPLASKLSWKQLPPVVLGAVAFALLFYQPAWTLVRDWLTDPDAGHGLLLGPVAVYLAWKRGIVPNAKGQPKLGLFLLFGAVLLRYVSGLAAELLTMRMSMLGAAGALVVYAYGFRQIRHWWLPTLLLILSVPLPALITSTLALPLQFEASKLGAAMLRWRDVPVLLTGNVIHLPGRSLFVTEACSGLRSLTSLIALSVLISGLWLRSPWMRVLLVAAAIPIAMFLNGVRIFLTGFLVYFVDPRLGEGVMHLTEGWGLFVVAMVILGGCAWLLTRIERLGGGRRLEDEEVAA